MFYLALTLGPEDEEDDELGTDAATPLLPSAPTVILPDGPILAIPSAPTLVVPGETPGPPRGSSVSTTTHGSPPATEDMAPAAPPTLLWATRPAPCAPSVRPAAHHPDAAAEDLAPPADNIIPGAGPAPSVPATVHASNTGGADHNLDPTVNPALTPAVWIRSTRTTAKAATRSAADTGPIPNASAAPTSTPVTAPTITITAVASGHDTDVAASKIVDQLEDEFHNRRPSFLCGREPPPTPAPRDKQSALPKAKAKPRGKAKTVEPGSESDLTDVEAEEIVLDLELEGKAGAKPKPKSAGGTKKPKGAATESAVGKRARK
jgi:hypothetical protein